MKTDQTLRCFIAIEISDEIRRCLAAGQKTCARSSVRVSWVPPENLHLTLAFLGYLDEASLPPLFAGLDEVAGAVAPFLIKVHGAGYFGRPGSPRVVWAGMEGPPPELHRLHTSLAGLLKGLGIPQEDRPFAPHITLGRVKGSEFSLAFGRADRPGPPRRAGTARPTSLRLNSRSADADKAHALTSALASIKNDAFGAVQVLRLLVMRSHVEQPRVRYSILHESPLKGT